MENQSKGVERELKSNNARIDISKSILEVFEKEPSTHISNFVLKNVTVKFKEDTTIEVIGERINWSFSFQNEFVEDLADAPSEKYTKLGYRTILDFFKGIKKPYVKMGWYKLEKTTPYHCQMSNWYVVF
jgi:hypothetical protein